MSEQKHPPVPKGVTRKLERDFDKGVDGQDKGKWFKLIEGRVRLGIRKKFFTMRVVQLQQSLSKDVIPPFLEVSRTSLDGALSHLV